MDFLKWKRKKERERERGKTESKEDRMHVKIPFILELFSNIEE